MLKEIDEIDPQAQKVLRQLNKNSGYFLDTEINEDVAELPNISEHHFRIEDAETIIQLERKLKNSKPMANIFQSRDEISTPIHFNNRLNELIQGLDSNSKKIQNHMSLETHGFNTLKDHYDETGLTEFINRIETQEITEKVKQLKIREKPQFHPRSSKPNCMQKVNHKGKLTQLMGRLSFDSLQP